MRKLIGIITLSAALVLPGLAWPTHCPFVDTNTGLPCLGIPSPAEVTVAGTVYECSYGHRWLEAR